MVAYAELHCHTNFSFLDGASWPAELVERATELGYTALAVTDHDGFYGAVQFNEAARSSGLPAVYGAEIGLPTGHHGHDPDHPGDPIPGPGSNPELAQSPNKKRRGRIRQMHGSKPTGPDPSDSYCWPGHRPGMPLLAN
jgi:predicted metal-dependent phosphoesterase TrpH